MKKRTFPENDVYEVTFHRLDKKYYLIYCIHSQTSTIYIKHYNFKL